MLAPDLSTYYSCSVLSVFHQTTGIVPFSRYSTRLQALFRNDQVAIQPAMITFPPLSSLSCLYPLFLLPFFLPSGTLSNLSLSFLITSDLNRHFGGTSAPFRIDDRTSTEPLCSQVMSVRPSISNSIGTKRHLIALCRILPGRLRGKF